MQYNLILKMENILIIYFQTIYQIYIHPDSPDKSLIGFDDEFALIGSAGKSLTFILISN